MRQPQSGGRFDERGVLIEVIAGEGGTDAKGFAENLFNAYLVYAARSNLTVELGETGPGKWSMVCNDTLAYSIFAREAGGHCVQRVPRNGGGAKHTSYVTVVVSKLVVRSGSLKEADIEETFQRGHGRGGQNVNKVSSAVRVKHRPTGLEVFINGRDQIKNRQIARQALAGKLDTYLKANQQSRAAYAGAGRGDKIRTYNLQDRRVTDHRTGVKVHSLDQILKEGRFEMLN